MTQFSHPAHLLLNALPNHFVAAQAEGVHAIIGLSLRDDSEWQIRIHDKVCEVVSEKPEHPDATMTMNADDFVALMHGALNPFSAVMSGKLKVGGNTALLTRLERWFSL